ncbi:MAG TPA: RagB/SusD family nutrient uptake outer membrane protein [Flavobacterium sp.]|nr:RagB/SusD family nutrient uptake outer membrane protein [Flavobacterium sp.]
MILLTGIVIVTSCSEEFLTDIDSNGLATEDAYYSSQSEAYAGLTSVYDVLSWDTFVGRLAGLNSASDDFYAGGGNSTDVNEIQVWQTYTLNPTTGPAAEYWKKGFSGVFRANVLLRKLPGVPMDPALIARYSAETKFLRAFYYFDLVRFFKNIPLIIEPIATADYYNVPQAAPEAVYAQIETDLSEAISALPASVPAATEGGRATQAAAKALLAKVYLFEGKYAESAQLFAEVNGNPGSVSPYGNSLLPNFADLWETNNKFNAESIFEIVHSGSGNYGDWNNLAGSEGFLLNQMVGPRAYVAISGSAPDYISGYSFNTVTEDLYNAYSNADARKNATIANLKQMKIDGIADYTPGYNDTGYFLEKFAGRVHNRHSGAGATELNWQQDTYEIRLADTYLMEAEAIVHSGGSQARAQALLDAVRLRAGLASIPATDDNIFNERRLELAGEGQRWFDLVRTNRAAAKLGSRGFVSGKNEILPIPIGELSNTVLQQNPNY